MKPLRSWEEAFPGRFLGASLLPDGKRLTLTIRAIVQDQLPGDDGKQENHGILLFEETDKQLVINHTNHRLLLAICRKAALDPQALVKTRITVRSEKCRLKAEETEGVRIVGSPDLAQPMEVMVKLPRRKAFKRMLEVTKV